jgi:cysteine-rich repeat protein/YVTN family beta-propeller protein
LPRPAAVPQQEDCATPGDEDGNGLADCADPACAAWSACQAGCGNGRPDPGEACDDGNAIDGDGCDHNCTVTACGNGVVAAGEACDDGNAIDGDACDHNCTVTACGNGIVTAGEACDDGNAIDGDGCESCQFAACSSGAPVEPGKGDSLPLAGPIARIVTSPANCFVYALSLGPPTQLVMFSTVSKREVVRISLPGAEDLAISPDGTYLVAAQADAKQLSVIDPATGRVTRTVLTGEAPSIVQVDNNGVAYYGLLLEDGYPEITAIFRIGLLAGIETPITTLDGADVTLSSDGNFLYAGESGTTGGNLFKYAVSAAASTAVDRTTYSNSYGFLNTDRHTYLSPGGQHIYFAGFQLDAHALDFVTGRTGELIYAEDAAGSFAVGASHVFDAALVRPVAELSHGASAAALTANDRELWYYGAPGRLYYVNMSELVGGEALGVREVAPGPLGRYSFAKLIHDPVRPRLYGVDTAAAEVVVIDARTLQPTRSIRVNTTPTDLAIDAAGTTLFVGHQDVQGFARIRLDDLTFERYVVTPRVTYQVAAVSNGRVVTIDEDQWTIPSLLDATTGAVLSEGSMAYDSALSATADGTTVFVGEADSTGGNATRYSVVTGALVATGHTPHGFYFPARSIAALPDGTGVYYAGVLLDGNDLGVQRYTVNEKIVAVSPDGRRALSSTGVYDVATGRRLGALPVTASAPAISPDSKKAFLFTGSAILSVDLSAF